MALSDIDFDKIGEKIDHLEVIISYRIIDLFSGHLYSSPIKAIEELVVNSYDAFSNNCYVMIPKNLDKDGVNVIVLDDGEGMDIEGLKELWMIADTKKRDPEREVEAKRKGRLPIGKFGIGKLASYVIGERITHITKKNNKYLSVSVNFSILQKRTEYASYPIDIREIGIKEVQDLYNKLLEEYVKPFELDKDEPDSWTLVVISNLKPKSRELSLSRLNWVISTALPLVPDFKCYLNGNQIESSKLSESILQTWYVGQNDEVAQELGYELVVDELDEEYKYKVNVHGIGQIWGKFELYVNTITKGKSESIGRSNGFFIMVRNRLINHEKPYFGLPVLSHAIFNRFRAVIYADGLDKYLVVNREDVYNIGHEYLESYLSKKFNEVRVYYNNLMTEAEVEYTEKYEELPYSLIKYPIRHATERIRQEEITPYIIQVPAKKEEIKELIQDVKLEQLEPEQPLAILDLKEGVVKANIFHPLRIEFQDEKSYINWAIAEAMLEVYMLEAGIDYHIVQSILKRRDRLLRVLVQKGPRSVTVVSRMLRETSHIASLFETACGDALEILGLIVTRMGQSGKPEGIATANLGTAENGTQLTYKLVYDAKSTTKDRVKTQNLNIGSTARHRSIFKTDFGIIIAPHFEDTKGEQSAAWQEAQDANITLIRAEDLAALIEYSAIKSLPLSKLKELFEKCITSEEVHNWILKFGAEEMKVPPIRTILNIIWELQEQDKKEPPSYGAIRYQDWEKIGESITSKDIKEWLKAFARFVPNLIITEENYVLLDQKPDIIIEKLISNVKELPDPSIGEDLIKATEK